MVPACTNAPKTECGCLRAGKLKTVAYVYPPRHREIAKERKKEKPRDHSMLMLLYSSHPELDVMEMRIICFCFPPKGSLDTDKTDEMIQRVIICIKVRAKYLFCTLTRQILYKHFLIVMIKDTQIKYEFVFFLFSTLFRSYQCLTKIACCVHCIIKGTNKSLQTNRLRKRSSHLSYQPLLKS